MIVTKPLSLLSTLAAGALATVPNNEDFLVEIRTGNQQGVILPASVNPVMQAQLTNENDCAISVSGPDGFLSPVMNISGWKDGVRPCDVGSSLSGEVWGFGRFSISFLPSNETCDAVTESCRPVLRVEGENNPMWKFDGKCEHYKVPPSPPYDYDLYQCGFLTRK